MSFAPAGTKKLTFKGLDAEERELQRDHVAVKHVEPQLARERAVLARMTRRAIGTRHHPGLAHKVFNVALVHIEGCNAGPAR